MALSVPERIEAYLQANGPTRTGVLTSYIAREAETSEDYIRQALGRLTREGRIEQPKRGYYQLPNGEANQKETAAKSEFALATPSTDMVRLPLVEVSAGKGKDILETDIEEFYYISRRHLRRQFGVDPNKVVVMRITGNSMVPTLNPGDLVFIVQHDGADLRGGAIYVFHKQHVGLFIKRVRVADNFRIELHGDNPAEGVITIDPADAYDFTIIGRMLSVMKSL